MRATREDVARLAGVSCASVSYVLNRSRKMSLKTETAVLDAVKQLNYMPDMVARSMKKNETMQLSLMVNDITNPFYGEIIEGFESAAIENGYFVNVCTGYRDINKYFDNYIARRVDGLFVVALPYKFDMDRLYRLTDNGICVVVSGNAKADASKVSSIENDYVSAMETAVAYLTGLGHKKIAYISGLSKSHEFDQRIEGYLSALEARHIPVGDGLLMEGEPPFATGIQDGYEMTKRLLSSGKEFTALIALNDMMAMGAITALREAGKSVPEDVSVMGFDDNIFDTAWIPSITTMGFSKAAFGRRAFELLYRNITEGTTDSVVQKLSLIPRNSTGPVKK
ncbi:MAG: LacI family DNA-binding transcriptional regulator [Lachnospiraceae bacterium]|nr:LacI family DNA-binding transcriptional regulator [Lachnospiraceae bacterium]